MCTLLGGYLKGIKQEGIKNERKPISKTQEDEHSNGWRQAQLLVTQEEDKEEAL